MDEHPCKVCELLDGDRTLKSDTYYCKLCDAWICNACGSNWLRRGMAAMALKYQTVRGKANA